MAGIKSIDKLKSILDDKYEIIGLIASGGMGEIYLGVHRVLGKKRAIKVIHQDVEKEKDIRKRFIQEARLAASIDHPGIIEIMDFGSHDAFDYLIMPYIEGVTLQEKLDDGPMAWEDAIDLMISMTDAISHAHKKEIIHRDIKPANYMIDANGQIILTDFGISKNLTDATLTAANTIMGSPKFMSPEQIAGKKVDKRSDLYSLGLVFYQMLTGINPFEAEEITSVMYKQVHEVPDHPSTVNSRIPQPVGDVLARLLEKDPEDRYPDADALLGDLHRLKQFPAQDAGGETVLQVPGAGRRHIQTQPEHAASSSDERPVSRLSDMATRIIRPLQRKERKSPEIAESVIDRDSASKKSSLGKKKIFAFVLALAGGIIVTALVLMVGFDLNQTGGADHQAASTEDTRPHPEPAAATEKMPERAEPAAGVPGDREIPATQAKIRFEPSVISETLEKDTFVVKTIHLFNDGTAPLSDIRIEAESDGDFNFLGPVSRWTVDIGAGGTASFDCPVNSANSMAGDIRTGRIKIYANGPQRDPQVIDVRLSVKAPVADTSAVAPAGERTKDKITQTAKPSKLMAVLRPRKIRESNLLAGLKKFAGRSISLAEIRQLLKPDVGFAGAATDPKTLASVQNFLRELPCIQFLDNAPCDILISCEQGALGEKSGSGNQLVFRSNFYDCGENCLAVSMDKNGPLPAAALEEAIKRYYCYHALLGLRLASTAFGGGHMGLEIPGKPGNVLTVNDQIRMCMTPALDSACMLIDINRQGVFKLFPIFDDQASLQKMGDTACSIDIAVSPPAGFEMIAALGVQNENLLKKYRNQMNPENPIVSWPFSGAGANSAMNFCEEIFFNLINEPPEKWAINCLFIRIVHHQ